ncbi:flavohemoprotein [Jeongeupia sp. HS-3]|uniref:globin domain-containing protein n=1 Tax=Jeongeupia sp. HS-3 TaxID=1009682 RepID=UPI0018A45949|nr:globin domain-containing protein [Jeongeupia sp. HS-3]BCL76983.1 flavohemoprotein [Jeongeupia sp. HS-3]
MLAPNHRATIDATLPVVAANATAITGCFYGRMLTAHPELRNLFNQGNQASGEQKQALAGAVYAYAQHCDAPGTIEPLLNRIAHKHASLGISPDMYTIVGRHLMAAIGEVLGDAVTAEIAEAWDTVYWRFAGELIAREAVLYKDAGITPASFLREYEVIERVAEGDVAVSLRLLPTDDKPAPAFKPGQYVSVQVDLPEIGLRQLRQYSLSDAADGKTLRITVKQEAGDDARPDGLVSMHLAQHAEVGSRWLVSNPFGDLALDLAADTPVVMISAGVGVTPMVAMRQHLRRLQPQRQGVFVHVAAHGGRHILKRELAPAANIAELIVYDDARDEDRGDHHGRFDLAEHAAAIVQSDADYYLCGPLAFMIAQRDALLGLGVAAERVHFEVFGPDLLTATL